MPIVSFLLEVRPKEAQMYRERIVVLEEQDHREPTTTPDVVDVRVVPVLQPKT
jgi:hypothetical protein